MKVGLMVERMAELMAEMTVVRMVELTAELMVA